MRKPKPEEPREDDDLSLAAMPSFDWPKNIKVLGMDDLRAHPIYWHVGENFEGEARRVFNALLLMVMDLYCIHPIVRNLQELSTRYSSADQVELWRRTVFLLGYNV